MTASSTVVSQKKNTQNIDGQLAMQHFQNKEYAKAANYFKKLIDKNFNPVYYENLLTCYVVLEQYDDAEKLARKTNRSTDKLIYQVDVGYVLKKSGQEDKSKQVFQKLIKELPSDNQVVMNVARRFQKRKEIDFAIDTYLRGRKLNKQGYPYNFDLAQLYYQKGDIEEMINEYLDVLLINENYIQSVQNALQTTLNPDPMGTKKQQLKTELLRRIQRNNDRIIFNEMLIWYYIQDENFRGAFTQAKAIDARFSENGKRILEIASLSRANDDYETAIECYNYIIKQGSSGSNYSRAKIYLVTTLSEKILTKQDYTTEELEMLEAEYAKTLKEFGKNQNTIKIIREYAHLLASYLERSNEAQQLLEEAISYPRLSKSEQAECKLLLGDILMIKGEIWEASLLYSQVEKAYKYDHYGEIAKFRNAKVSFYTGDFVWAKTQLDVLKGSTSRLISNDAMSLSLLISDNTVFDTVTTALELYAQADLLFSRQKFDESLEVLSKIETIYATHSILEESLFLQYKIQMRKKNHEQAGRLLEKIVTEYDYEIIADKALFEFARLNERFLNNPDKAQELYLKLMTDFPDSLYVTESRKRFRSLRKKSNEGNELIIDEADSESQPTMHP